MKKQSAQSIFTMIRRSLLIPVTVLCMAITMMFVPAATAQACDVTMHVVNCNEWISLRTSPSTSASVITTIPLGAEVIYIDDACNGFYKVSYQENIGYALASYLEFGEGDVWAIEYVANCNEWISLRTAPNTSASVITTIELGAPVSVCLNYDPQQHNGFANVSYNGYCGYVLAEYLDCDPYEQSMNYNNWQPADGHDVQTMNCYTMQVVNCQEWISLRTSPSTSASVITTIPLGAYVSFISTASNGFYKVSYYGYEGYALASYLSADSQTMFVVNCNEWISLRTSPSTSASVIVTIPLGSAVTYISSASNGFYKINYNGYVGYALASYLSY